jgi:hypothetical protein
MLQSPTPRSTWRMPVMPANMPAEAHCQEDRGINTEMSHRLYVVDVETQCDTVLVSHDHETFKKWRLGRC